MSLDDFKLQYEEIKPKQTVLVGGWLNKFMDFIKRR